MFVDSYETAINLPYFTAKIIWTQSDNHINSDSSTVHAQSVLCSLRSNRSVSFLGMFFFNQCLWRFEPHADHTKSMGVIN